MNELECCFKCLYPFIICNHRRRIMHLLLAFNVLYIHNIFVLSVIPYCFNINIYVFLLPNKNALCVQICTRSHTRSLRCMSGKLVANTNCDEDRETHSDSQCFHLHTMAFKSRKYVKKRKKTTHKTQHIER